MKVVKFGGSSLANGEQFKKVIAIVTAQPERQVVITSAPGKRFSDDIKVTDLLITYAEQFLNYLDTKKIQEKIFDRYQEIAQTFELPTEQLAWLKKELQQLQERTYPSAEYLLAAFKAHGEYFNARLLTLILNHLKIKARFIDPREVGLLVSSDPNNATVLPVTYENLARLDYTDEKLIFPGFFGVTKEGEIATFSRGGSDITGAIVARGLNAELYENFTDVDAIYAADPRLVQDPYAVTKMTYREMRELSYAGFSVFHDEAIVPAIEGRVKINVKNTNHPERPGTMIIPYQEFTPITPITGISSAKRFSALYLHKFLLNKEAGFTLKILNILYKYGISYEHMPSGIDDLTIIFDNSQLTEAKRKAVSRDIRAVIQPDELRWIDDYALIMVVGEGMINRIGIMKDVILAISDHNINIHMINQGSSEVSIMLGTKSADADKAVKYIYEAFFEQK
ncbi:aspartate kinase [Ligilactobacillus murinus]|uniref:aspartate kinase n=1 Tax=Ligilactobacillus murinus TaxID=1622 RepID=UPI00386435C4